MKAFKVCVLGDYGVGKTSTVNRFVSNVFSENYATTIGLSISTKTVTVDFQDVKMVIWDIAGRDKVAAVEHTYLKGANAVFFVADGTREKTLQTMLDLRRDVLKEHGEIANLVMINKYDRKHEWEVTDTRIEMLRNAGRHVYLTSAKDGTLVNDAFSNIATQLLKQ